MKKSLTAAREYCCNFKAGKCRGGSWKIQKPKKIDDTVTTVFPIKFYLFNKELCECNPDKCRFFKQFVVPGIK